MIDRGVLTATRIPGSITRIPKAEVEALIARSTRPASVHADSTSAA